jgi:hypothetical protein
MSFTKREKPWWPLELCVGLKHLLQGQHRHKPSILAYLNIGTGNACASQRKPKPLAVPTSKEFDFEVLGTFGAALPTGSACNRMGSMSTTNVFTWRTQIRQCKPYTSISIRTECCSWVSSCHDLYSGGSEFKSKPVERIYWFSCFLSPSRQMLIYTRCIKKSFTTLKAYVNLFRGHLEHFELS